MQWLRKILPDKTPADKAAYPPPPCPAHPICIIGDVHGRADLLEAILLLIGNEADAETARLIFVGDLIDRGPNSAAVLSRVRQLTEYAPDRVICLMGNHEQMLLDFITSPVDSSRWLRHGAVETLASLGIRGRAEGNTPEDRLRFLANDLRNALPEGTEAWLRDLPFFWQEGNLAVAHAAADPNLPMAEQTARSLIWGHHNFMQIPRKDGLWLAHGHTVVEAATAEAGRISVDTGAWTSGRLTAAWLNTDGLRFIEAR